MNAVVGARPRAGSAARARRARARRSARAPQARLARSVRRAFIVLLAAPLAIRLLVVAILVVALWSGVNAMYQVVRRTRC